VNPTIINVNHIVRSGIRCPNIQSRDYQKLNKILFQKLRANLMSKSSGLPRSRDVILVSREYANTRRLLNEDKILVKLKDFNIKKYSGNVESCRTNTRFLKSNTYYWCAWCSANKSNVL
jgi:hypothetical protein